METPEDSDEISSEENVNFEEEDYVAEEMKDSYFISQGELINNIVKAAENEQNETVLVDAVQHLEEQFKPTQEEVEDEDGSVQICTMSNVKYIQKEKKRKLEAKIHPYAPKTSASDNFDDLI